MRITLAGVKTYFDATMETILTAMESEYSDTITRLKYMDTKNYAGRQFPFMEILPNEGNNDYLSDDAPEEMGWKYREVKCVVVHNSSNIDKVQDTLLYYEDAINKLVENDNTFGNLFNRVRVTEMDYSEMGQWVETKNYEQSVLIIMEIRRLLSF